MKPIFDNKPEDWQKVDRMIEHLPTIKDPDTKRRQKVLICRQLIKALKGGK